jgi:hypothetical protein
MKSCQPALIEPPKVKNKIATATASSHTKIQPISAYIFLPFMLSLHYGMVSLKESFIPLNY